MESQASPTPSRRSSPPPSSSNPPMDLTPRSKVNRMLADLDSNDSDDDLPVASVRSPTKFPTPSPSRVSAPKAAPSPSQAGSLESDEDSDVPPARRGTLAARMEDAGSQGELKDDAVEQDDSYSRVRRTLMAQPSQVAAKEHETQPAQPSLDQDSDATAKFIPRAHASAVVSPRRSTSPGLFVSPQKELDMSANGSSANGESGQVTSHLKIADRLQALAKRKREKGAEREKSKDLSSGEEDPPSPPKKAASKKPRNARVAIEFESGDDAEASKHLTQQTKPVRQASKKAKEEMDRHTQRITRNKLLNQQAHTKTTFSTADLFAKFNFRQPKTKAAKERPVQQQNDSSATQSSDTEPTSGRETPPSSPPTFVNGSAANQKIEGPASEQESRAQAQPTRDLEADDRDDLPDLAELTAQGPKHSVDMAQQASQPVVLEADIEDGQPEKRASARRFAKSAVRSRKADGSDDELEIVRPRKPSRLAIFDKIPASKAKESHSLHALRALAHLHDFEKTAAKKGKQSMSPAELQTLLHRRARAQAIQERDEKIQRLREKGVLIQTDEEKEKEERQLVNLLEKARRDTEALTKEERLDARKEAKKRGEILDDDSDKDDSDYQASGEEDVNDQLSGSEDEDESERIVEEERDEQEEEEQDLDDQGEYEFADGSDYGKDDVAGESKSQYNSGFFQNEASDDGEEEISEQEHNVQSSDEEQQVDSMLPKHPRPTRRRVVDSDDEDDMEHTPHENEQTPQRIRSGPPITPAASKAPPKTPKTSTSDAFGFSNRKPAAPLGLSQVFAGTMAEDRTQMDDASDSPVTGNQDSMDFLRTLPAPELPNYDDALVADSPRSIVEDSQAKETPSRKPTSQLSDIVNFGTQTQRPDGETQISELPEPTQDAGFQISDSQPSLPQASYSTVDTLPIEGETSPDSQPRRRKRRLQNRNSTIRMVSSEDEAESEGDQGKEAYIDAFDRMKREQAEAREAEAAKDVFDKKQSKAKEMFQEQAEESEDEYAGLGGASDDESQGELDDETKQMIDDEGNERTNERDIAAYYAEKSRIDDEAGVEKLFDDVVNGGLRKKQGAGGDLLDWDDDEDEKAARRREYKQRDNAKRMKALLADEKVGKIAQNPKQAAFLQAIEDRNEGEELDFFDQPEESFEPATLNSQQDGHQTQPLSDIPANTAGRKRTHDQYSAADQDSQDAENMPPPPNPRRTKAAKVTRPTSLADIRNTLSEIIGEPDSVFESQRLASTSPPPSSYEKDQEKTSNHEAQDEDDEDDILYRKPSRTSPPAESRPSTANPRRTNPNATRNSVIDRVALRKQSSSARTSSMDPKQARLAFQTTSGASFSTKTPSLLRRATTNSSTDSTMTSAAATAAAAGAGTLGKDTVKRGGTAKSSVNYYVREMERKAKVEKVEKERMERRVRMGTLRRKAITGGGSGGMATGKERSRLGGLVGGGFD